MHLFGRPVDIQVVPPLAIVSTVVPPGASGQCRVLERLLVGKKPAEIFLFSEQSPDLSQLGVEHQNATYIQLSPAQFLLFRGISSERLKVVNNFLGLNRTIFRRAREISDQLVHNKPQAIIGCSGNPFDIASAFLAARRLNVPFIAYLFDDPVYQWPVGIYRSLAKFWERIWAKRARAILAPNEMLIADFKLRHSSAELTILRNPVGAEAFVNTSSRVFTPESAPKIIIYSGTVYHAQADALRNLISIVTSSNKKYALHVYTSQSQATLDEHGVCGEGVTRHEHVSQELIYKIQQQADVLFLPLTFESAIAEVIRTSAPGKLAEYLASGTPVLVHAPASSYISQFFNKNNCGLVVDKLDRESLMVALEKILQPSVSGALVDHAKRLALDFHEDKSRSVFWGVVDAVGAPK
jgi:glycosyltransferase involved in cell wall biosynthesis